jgi:hypothetical protein
MITKTKRVDLRASEADEKNLQLAAEKMGEKKISKVIFNSVKQVANKPIEYGIDRISIRHTLANIEYVKTYLQAFLDEFKIVTAQTLTRDELENIFSNIGKLGSTQILENSIKAVVSKKLYDQMVRNHSDMNVTIENIPAKDMTRLFELSDKLDNAPEIKLRFAGIYWFCYEVNEAGQVNIIQYEVDSLTDNYRFTATSPTELKKLSAIQDICESLNSLLKDPEVQAERIFDTVYFDSEARKFAPSGSYIKGPLMQPTILFEHYH